MKLLFFLSLLLLITINYAASYKDNQTDIYVKDYSGDLVKQGNVSFEASRIIIGVKEGVTKDQVDQIAKSIGGEISGWSIVPGLYDSYSIEVVPDRRELAFTQLKLNPLLVYSIKNYQYNIDYIQEPTESFLLPYEGEIIKDDRGHYFDANAITLSLDPNGNITKKQVENMIKPYNGRIFGWFKYGHGYDIFLPADQRELAIKELPKNPGVIGADRNYYSTHNDSDEEDSHLLLFLVGFIILIFLGFYFYKRFKKI